MRFPTMPEGLDHQRKRLRRLAPAGIIEVIAGEWRTPIGQYPDQPSLRNVGLHVSLRHVGKAQSLECSIQQEASAVEYQLSLDAHVERPPILLEFPRIKAATVGR